MSVELAPNEEGPNERAPIPLFGRSEVSSLPSPVTPLIGREDAVTRVTEMLADPEIRLLTLVGPGGIGKTRLALAAARRIPIPATFVSLAATTEPALIVPTIAQALNLELALDLSPDVALGRALNERILLLVLDNFEQLLAGATIVGELLRSCSGLRVLVTSRVRLSLSGEHVVPVDPLALPESGSPEEIADVSAVRLFVERARAVHPSFVLNEGNAAAIVTICRRLDGLPLAIELAAALSNLLSPNALAARLERRLNLLTSGPNDAPTRHQTMRAAIAWSSDLLTVSERAFWERLGVFTGGFTAEAAEAIGKESSEAEFDGVMTLQSLIDQGLLQPTANRDGEPRFQMLETTREFALERLVASGEESTARTAHAGWFSAFAALLEPGLMGSDPDPWFNRGEADIANLRSAMSWLRDRGDVAAALEIANSLAWFWTAPNYIAEGRSWYAQLLTAATPDLDPALIAQAAQAAGDLAIWHGDTETAVALLQEAVSRWREVGDQGRIAATLCSLGSVAIDRLAFGDAAQLLEEAFVLSRDAGRGWDAAAAANLLGVALLQLGKPLEAAEWHSRALTDWQRLGHRDHWPAALNALAWAHLAVADFHRAWEYLDAAINIAGEDEANYDSAHSLVIFAAIAARLNQDVVAVRLLGIAALQCSQLALPLRPHVQTICDRLADELRNSLGNAAFAVAWNGGQNLSNTDAIREARAIQIPDPPTEFGLSRREREVLKMLVEGASDHDIADKLFITRRTASKHVAAILEKLGATNRTAAATAAHRRGLV